MHCNPHDYTNEQKLTHEILSRESMPRSSKSKVSDVERFWTGFAWRQAARQNIQIAILKYCSIVRVDRSFLCRCSTGLFISGLWCPLEQLGNLYCVCGKVAGMFLIFSYYSCCFFPLIYWMVKSQFTKQVGTESIPFKGDYWKTLKFIHIWIT